MSRAVVAFLILCAFMVCQEPMFSLRCSLFMFHVSHRTNRPKLLIFVIKIMSAFCEVGTVSLNYKNSLVFKVLRTAVCTLRLCVTRRTC